MGGGGKGGEYHLNSLAFKPPSLQWTSHCSGCVYSLLTAPTCTQTSKTAGMQRAHVSVRVVRGGLQGALCADARDAGVPPPHRGVAEGENTSQRHFLSVACLRRSRVGWICCWLSADNCYKLLNRKRASYYQVGQTFLSQAMHELLKE